MLAEHRVINKSTAFCIGWPKYLLENCKSVATENLEQCFNKMTWKEKSTHTDNLPRQLHDMIIQDYLPARSRYNVAHIAT